MRAQHVPTAQGSFRFELLGESRRVVEGRDRSPGSRACRHPRDWTCARQPDDELPLAETRSSARREYPSKRNPEEVRVTEHGAEAPPSCRPPRRKTASSKRCSRSDA